jgi:cysteine desulfurase family protein (TIGR01976 family)
MDHDANLAPWLTVARERGLVVRWIEVRPDDATLDLDSLELALGPRTRMVAVSLASNAVGSLTDMGRVVEMAHASGALLFVDAVHAAAHVPIDVSAMRTDFLVCSPYKFYGPHLGVLYGRRELLERVDTDRVRPAGDALPARLETGTLSHEALAGLLGTYAYLSSLGRVSDRSAANGDRRESLRAAMMAIRAYERELTAPLLGGLASVPGIRVLGISDPARAAERVPTVAFTVADFHPRRVAESLAARAINVWDGTMYAPELMRALGVDASSGGVVRAGLVHYNTTDEIDRLVTALTEIVAAGS